MWQILENSFCNPLHSWMLIRNSGFLFRRMLTECLKCVPSKFWQVELAMECLEQRLDIKKMLSSYIKYDRNNTLKSRVLGCKADAGERESTRLFLLSAFSGIRLNKGFVLSVGSLFHKNLRSFVSFLKSQRPLAKYCVNLWRYFYIHK